MPKHPQNVQAGPRGPAFFCRRRVARYLVLILLLLAVVITPASGSEPALRTDGRVGFLCADGPTVASVEVEIAETPQAREKGMMGRESLDFSEGMLFVWEREAARSFWMRNTPTSLDMIFADRDGRILNVIRRTTPMSDHTYFSRGPAKYVVEVKGGFAARFGIDESCRIEWRRHQGQDKAVKSFQSNADERR